MPIKPLKLFPSLILFGIPSVYFFLIAYGFIPFLNFKFHIHPLLSWIIGASFLFIPLFILAFYLFLKEGNKLEWENVKNRFRLHRLNSNGWLWTIAGTAGIFLLTGLIMLVSRILSKNFGIRELNPNPPFLEVTPLTGGNRLILLAWLPMFFFNIFGEELLWRGYILPRQELSFGKFAWVIQALLWLIFHLCFGLSPIILLLPVLFIVPFVAQKTKSTIPGIIMHAVLNGPSFVLISLGLIKF